MVEQGRKVHRFPEKIKELKETGSCFPVHFEVDLTNRCALTCKGCHSMHFRDQTSMNMIQIFDVLYQLKEKGVKSILFAGGGDPLENENWREALEWARRFNFKSALYSYLPKITQDDVDFISDRCSFVVGHNTKRPVKHPDHQRCRWICGYLLDNENWPKIPKMIEDTNFDLYDYCYFRPLLTFTDDYKWVPEAAELFRKHCNGKAQWADHKFEDLVKPNFGRDYQKCYGTFITGVVGADGSIWECCNRMGSGALGNAFGDGRIEGAFKVLKPREDFTGCPPACKNQKINQVLWEDYFGPEPENVEFL